MYRYVLDALISNATDVLFDKESICVYWHRILSISFKIWIELEC